MAPINLDEFDPEETAGLNPESGPTTAIGYTLALCAFVALRCDSLAYHAERVAKDASRTRRRFAALLHRRQPRPSPDTTSSHLESEGTLVATALAVVALGYGGLLLTTWREPARTSQISVATPATAGLVPAISGAAHTVAPTPATAVVTATPLGPPTDVRPRSRGVTAASLNTILRRTDARSLQHAFDDVRRETLAFHRCGMQMTSADRAVANCEGVLSSADADGHGGGRRVRWTIDFQRIGSRWSIQRIAAR